MVSELQSVNNAFSKQSLHFDEDDANNPVLQRMRQQVYRHVEQYIKPKSKILELNAGTGIDALYFIGRGHHVHATDLSTGMIDQLRIKAKAKNIGQALTVQQLSYTELDKLVGKDFDYVFSNFGGLNCISDSSTVTRHLPSLLKRNGYITFVIMPVICPWEIAGIFRNGKQALRRFRPQGVLAHLEGEFFQTYYHSLTDIRKSFDSRFRFVRTEGLAALSPQPHNVDFEKRSPRINKLLHRIDSRVRNHFPFNRWADHLIVTFQYTP